MPSRAVGAVGLWRPVIGGIAGNAVPPAGALQGAPNPLQSSFKLTYYTLLNLMRRTEGGGADSMEKVIEASFQQFQQNVERPQVGGQWAGQQPGGWAFVAVLAAGGVAPGHR